MGTRHLVCVVVIEGDKYKLGQCRDDWCEENFDFYHGTVTLYN